MVLILLPPSETKRDGGDPTVTLDLTALSFPELARQRRQAIAGVRKVSQSVVGATQALGLGPTQRFEIARNRTLGSSPVMPAIDRYTGVLYDGLAASELDVAARAFVERSVVVHSALFGLVRATDLIPAYRFSHNSRIPGMLLGRLWREPITRVLADQPGLILDLRSEIYAELGPAPVHESSVFLRVVARDAGGTKRALNHFNKKGKGEFVRALALSGRDVATVHELREWARSEGLVLESGAPGELDLVV